MLIRQEATDRDAHVRQVGHGVLRCWKDGSLPDDSALDASQFDVAHGQASTAQSSGDQLAAYAPATDLLGGRCSNVPVGLHSDMLRLVADGTIPKTTLDQRRRNRRTSGSCYGVPQFLKAALEHGYIHPNIEDPAGFSWKHKEGRWLLPPKGG